MLLAHWLKSLLATRRLHRRRKLWSRSRSQDRFTPYAALVLPVVMRLEDRTLLSSLQAVSLADPMSGSVTPDGDSSNGSISSDGRYVAFASNATNIAGQFNNNPVLNVYVFDRLTGVAQLVSHRWDDTTARADGLSENPRISADGKFVVFRSFATDLVAGQSDAVGTVDVFLYDVAAQTTSLVSHSVSGLTTTGNAHSLAASISADGKFVVFQSFATDLVAGQSDADGTGDVFLYDVTAQTTTLVSHSASGLITTGNAGSAPSSISADGKRVAYISLATNLVAGQSDTNGNHDVFLYDAASQTTTLVSRSTAGLNTTGNNRSGGAAISADGRLIAYESAATNVVADQSETSLDADIFVYDVAAQTTTLVSHSTAGLSTTGNNGSSSAMISADGRFIAYHSAATNLVAGQSDVNNSFDSFLYDLSNQATILVSHSTDGPATTGDGDSDSPALSADGNFVVFNSRASDLVIGDLNQRRDLFLFSRTVPPDRLVVSSPTPSVTANRTLSFTVTALDALNNPATDYRGTIHFSSSDGIASLPTDYTFTESDAGVHTFTFTLQTPGIQTVTVTDVGDGSLIANSEIAVYAPFTVFTTADAGDGSLRQAILDANSSPNAVVGGTVIPDTITFQVGTGHQVILPASDLPNVTDATIIDGTTQPGFAGTPLIELSGSGVRANGIWFEGGDSTLKGLILNGFTNAAVVLTEAAGNVIQGNYIGTNASGTAAIVNANWGIVVVGAGNLIGTDGDGVDDAAERNVISGNTSGGVLLWTSASFDNVVAGNYIGTNAMGTAPIVNGIGVQVLSGAFANRIGTDGDGTADVAERNIIGRSNGSGIRVDGSHDIAIAGNYIGTDWTGSVALGGTTTGVLITNSSHVRLGTDGNGTADADERNVISGNSQGGVLINGTSSDNTVAGNYIGTAASGATAVPNGSTGVVVVDLGNNTIGGDQPAEANVISGNVGDGIFIAAPSQGNRVQGNFIGVDRTGTSVLANGQSGVVVLNSLTNVIGSDGDGIEDSAEGNLISGNAGNGIALVSNANSTRVQGNLVGTDITGMSALPNRADGIFISSSFNTIGGLSETARNIFSGNLSNGVSIANRSDSIPQNNVIQGNYIGTNAAGNAALGNTYSGVFLGASFNTIGGGAEGAGNLISGNQSAGIWVDFVDAPSQGNTIQGNSIGTDISGALAIGNLVGGVFFVNGSHHNTIGTDSDGSADDTEGNLISGNGQWGVVVVGDGSNQNVIAGNVIGADATGLLPLGNQFHGVSMGFGASGNIIGGTSASARNLISGNHIFGINIVGTGSGNFVQGNYVGIDVTGMAALPNQGGGVFVSGSGNTIGGTTTAARNVISGNLSNGVTIANRPENNPQNNVVQGNYIGTNAAGNAALSNAHSGVFLGASFNTIGGGAEGAGNLISGNQAAGIWVDFVDAPSQGNTIQGNVIGTDLSGTLAIGNLLGGVYVLNGSHHNTIGTDSDGSADDTEGNLISGNGQWGVLVVGAGANQNVIAGNVIGADATGLLPLANQFHGVAIGYGASENTIGGTTTSARNVISGNQLNGIVILGGNASGNVVQGNFIGTDVTGMAALPNQGDGVFVSGSGNTIGGTTTAARNVISGNRGNGVSIANQPDNNPQNNAVQGNYIGTNATGNAALGNTLAGVVLGASFNTIGGEAEGAGNLISGNMSAGIRINFVSLPSQGNVIQGNLIGTDATGALPIGNLVAGVTMGNGARDNTVGGVTAGQANRIAYNDGNGVNFGNLVMTGNSIRGNSIYANTRLGIDLGNNGITPNDANDADSGPNRLQNYPIIESIGQGAATHAVGTLHATPGSTFTLDFYANALADPSGHGEGARWIGAIVVHTDSSGNATFDQLLSGSTSSGEWVAATATAADGSTSEFSQTVPVNAAPTAVALQNVTTSLVENTSTAGAIPLAEIVVTDDALGTNVLGLSGADADDFEIVGNALRLRAGTLLDYESKSRYDVTVTVDDISVGTTPDTATDYTLNVVNLADLLLTSVTTNGVSTLTVNYLITDDAVAPFELRFVRSADPLFDGGDATLDSVTIANPAHRTVGAHSLTFAIGAATAEISLPGTTAPDSDADYRILVVADPANVLPEDDLDPAYEDNTKPLNGAYFAGGQTYAFGSDGNDTMAVAKNGSVFTLSIAGATFSYSGPTAFRLRGEGGNDSLTVSANLQVPVFLWGGDGDDILTGGNVSDRLEGGSGNDSITGGGGNDNYVFDADTSPGSDTLTESGGGIDLLDYSATEAFAISVNLGTTTTQAVSPTLMLKLNSATTFENVMGGTLGDTLTGSGSANAITGGPGDDVLAGGAGNDTYLFDADTTLGADTLAESGGGIDTLDFSGTTGIAVSVNLGMAIAQSVNPNLTLTLGSATVFENLIGGTLGDTLTGNDIANSLTGGAGDDILTGAGGNDLLTGGSGNDSYRFDADTSLGSDTLNEGGGGVDTLDFSATTGFTVSVNLALATAQVVNPNLTLTLGSAAAFDNVIGGAMGDTLRGNALNNVIFGGGGSDTLLGFGGRDLLVGGTGADTLDGGDGDDILIGGLIAYYDEDTDVLNRQAIDAIMAEWARSDLDFATRLSHLRLGGGLNGNVLLDSSIVADDGAIDTLTGGKGQDWFWRLNNDAASDAKTNGPTPDQVN